MGKFFSKFFSNNRERKVLMVGLDAAGKTTILYRLRLGKEVEVNPTIGFNMETIKVGKIDFATWDVGGGDKIRLIWRHYAKDCSCFIFVIDSTDKDRIDLAKKELHRVFREEVWKDVKLWLILANKKDVEDCLTPGQITEILELDKFENKIWRVQATSGKTGEGLKEAFDWMADTLDALENNRPLTKEDKPKANDNTLHTIKEETDE